MCNLPEGLRGLASVIADWAASRTVIVYVFGSRARGDHRPGSDVDAYVHLDLANMDHDTVVWWTRQQQTSYADLLPLLPGPLGDTGHAMLDNQDIAMVRKVMGGDVVYTDRNVICVRLPPKPMLE